MYIFASIQSVRFERHTSDSICIVPFDEAIFSNEKKFGVFGFNGKSINLLSVYSCLSKAVHHANSINEHSFDNCSLSQLAKCLFEQFSWISATPCQQWGIKYDYASARGFNLEKKHGFTSLVSVDNEDEANADIYFINSVENGEFVELISTCYSHNEAVILSSVINFVINPVVQ